MDGHAPVRDPKLGWPTRSNRNGRPVLALIEDRPGAFHYVVVVGVPERGIIFHDPARSSYRVMPRDQFAARWRASQRWMAVVTPRAAGAQEPAVVTVAAVATPVAGSPCEALVAEGVRQSQAGDFAGAERTLTSALACPGGAAYRELAGLRVLQKRWNDAADLADTATQADAGDAYAWRLLATARFLQDDRPGALAALNQAGEPAVDTVQVIGLERTRAEVIEDAIDVDRGELLTPGALARANRRLKEVPAIRATALEFVPVSGGRAEVRATVTERRLFPTGMAELGEMAFRSIFQQDPRASIGSMTGSGERLDLQYRFRRERPRLGMTLLAPAPWGGVWSVQGIWERQPFDSPEVETSERTTGRVTWTDWMSGRFQVSRARRRRSLAGHRLARHGGREWRMPPRSTTGSRFVSTSTPGWATRNSAARGRSPSTARRTGAKGWCSSAAPAPAWRATRLPLESWFAGDSGTARPGPVLLRAHGLVHRQRGTSGPIRWAAPSCTGRAKGRSWFRLPAPSTAAKRPIPSRPASSRPVSGAWPGPGALPPCARTSGSAWRCSSIRRG